MLVGGFVVDMPGGIEVFGRDPKRFKEGDFSGVVAAGFFAGEDFADLGCDVGLIRFGGQLGCVDHAASSALVQWAASHSAGLQ